MTLQHHINTANAAKILRRQLTHPTFPVPTNAMQEIRIALSCRNLNP